jgi:hypothetical protein
MQLLPAVKPAAVDKDDERRGLIGFRLPQIEDVPGVRAILELGDIGPGLLRRLFFLGGKRQSADQRNQQRQATRTENCSDSAHRALLVGRRIFERETAILSERGRGMKPGGTDSAADPRSKIGIEQKGTARPSRNKRIEQKAAESAKEEAARQE